MDLQAQYMPPTPAGEAHTTAHLLNTHGKTETAVLIYILHQNYSKLERKQLAFSKNM